MNNQLAIPHPDLIPLDYICDSAKYIERYSGWYGPKAVALAKKVVWITRVIEQFGDPRDPQLKPLAEVIKEVITKEKPQDENVVPRLQAIVDALITLARPILQ
jgi:hypothetical protein